MQQMKNDIKTINKWLKLNNLQLSINKTNYMIFDKTNKIITHPTLQ